MAYMQDYKRIIANNISELRKAVPMTQAELAERLNYSDKAISKWERGESIPDVSVLKEIADVFGVTVDYLLEEIHPLNAKMQSVPRQTVKSRTMVVLMSCTLAWFIATLVFVLLWHLTDLSRIWLCFIYPIPVNAIIGIVFNSIWGKAKYNFMLISVLVWSILACIYLSVGVYESWGVFVIGIPAQIIILLWSGTRARFLRSGNKQKKQKAHIIDKEE